MTIPAPERPLARPATETGPTPTAGRRIDPFRSRPGIRRYGASLGSFVVKGVCALLITYLVANSVGVEDFALWATTFSFGMVLSVADLGVGQLVLTTLHENEPDPERDRRLMATSIVTVSGLALVLFVLGSALVIALDLLPALRWRLIILAVIVARLVFIPFGAALSAHERYHERKAFEAASYLLGLIFVFLATRAQVDISSLLLGLMIIITLGSAAAGVRAVLLRAVTLDLRRVTPREVRTLLASSTPYFVNNASGLAIYGGFIALSATVLDEPTTARLALLHSLVLMQVFQLYELIFRTAQVRMGEIAVIRRLRLLVLLGAVAGISLLAAVGPQVIGRVFGKYQYRPAELAVYGGFAFLEVFYLLVTSRMQMQSALARRLQTLSLVKAGAFALLLAGAAILRDGLSLLGFSVGLLSFSLIMACVASVHSGALAPAPGDHFPAG